MKVKSSISQNQQQQQARSVPRPKQKEQFMKTNAQRTVAPADLLFDKHLLLRKGKRNYVVLTAK